MDELTDDQIAELGQLLRDARGELKQLLEMTREGTQTVELDEPIGRLTRMDAMQQQSLSAANRRDHDLRRRQVQPALNLIERGDYGLCRRCEDPIGYPRLKARPESPYCIDCQDEIDSKQG